MSKQVSFLFVQSRKIGLDPSESIEESESLASATDKISHSSRVNLEDGLRSIFLALIKRAPIMESAFPGLSRLMGVMRDKWRRCEDNNAMGGMKSL